MTPEEIERSFAYGGDFTREEARELARQVAMLLPRVETLERSLGELVDHVDVHDCCEGLKVDGQHVYVGESKQVPHAADCPYREAMRLLGRRLPNDVSPVQ